MSESRDDITESQFEALNKAWELLKEHFDCVVVAYDTECKDGTDRTFECCYNGGHSAGIGLHERAKWSMMMDKKKKEDL